MTTLREKYLSMALSLVGGAVLLCACEDTLPPIDPAAEEVMMTEYCEDLTIVESQSGQRSYRFYTPLVEGYSQAREPYREFRKGIRMVTYQDDSLSSVDVVLTANYAIYYEKRKLWEAKGNVVVEKFDGKKLYTQQLFWNATTKKVYSNVDTRIVQGDRVDAIGAGFETDEEFKDWRFRYSRGQTDVDVAPREPSDSVRQAEPAAVRNSDKADSSGEVSSGRNASAADASSVRKASPARETARKSVRPAGERMLAPAREIERLRVASDRDAVLDRDAETPLAAPNRPANRRRFDHSADAVETPSKSEK